jgi:hypothetical protein
MRATAAGRSSGEQVPCVRAARPKKSFSKCCILWNSAASVRLATAEWAKNEFANVSRRFKMFHLLRAAAKATLQTSHLVHFCSSKPLSRQSYTPRVKVTSV